MNRMRPLTVPCLAMLLGCASAELRPRPAALDPSNPAAPEAPLTPAPALTGGSLIAKEATAAVAPGEVVYTCSMHPEIMRDTPGQCPKCGMALVSRPKSEGAPAHQHSPQGEAP